MIDLSQYKITRRQSDGCKCKESYTYTIPIQIDIKIIQYLNKIGVPAFNFKTTNLIKIENKDLIITGIKRAREIKIMLKNKDKSLLDVFEECLVSYIKGI